VSLLFKCPCRVQTLAESSTSLQRAIEHFGTVSQMSRLGIKPVQSASSWSSSHDDSEVVDWIPEPKCCENLSRIMDNCEIAKNQVIYTVNNAEKNVITNILFYVDREHCRTAAPGSRKAKPVN
jgi:hypothetical protein